MSDKQFYLLFYLALCIIVGTGEYLHLIPAGTLDVVLGGILVHGVTLNGAKNGPPSTPPEPSAQAGTTKTEN